MVNAEKHFRESTLRERIVEHLFVGEVLKYFWKREETDIEVLRSEFDSGGYDLIISKASVTRHIQFKTSMDGGSNKEVSVNIKLANKLNGCIIWITVDNSLNLTGYRWFGAAPGEPFPDISKLKTTKHTKANSKGEKTERPNHRIIQKNNFKSLENLEAVVEKLFGKS